jgi:uncharacterized protein YjiS (DUF1127 family)
MLLKLKFATTKHPAPVNQVWSVVVTYVHARRQRARDRRVLARMNDHHLRDIGLSRSSHKPFDRAR